MKIEETDQKNEETDQKYWESPQKYWEIPLKYLNKIKGKRIYNSGKSIKKEETPKNLKCLKKPVFEGFPHIFDPFPFRVVSVLRCFHVTISYFNS